jgi:uncharacterized protein with NRDE domain
MCTVTFISSGDKIYITSNRDEKAWRTQALPPRFYFHNDVQLIYPKDQDAGGSWIAMNENGNAAVLLNGAFSKHISSPPYRKSRGLIFLDIAKSRMPLNYYLKIDLDNIEPFTLIIFQEDVLYECRWDASNKYYKELDRKKNYIWSSATLYDDEVIKKRERWFSKWLNNNRRPGQKDILKFHQFAGEGNKHTDLLMNRDGVVHTVSVTGIELSHQYGVMRYLDLKTGEAYNTQLEIHPTTVQYQYNA